jgi:hypothetical protein
MKAFISGVATGLVLGLAVAAAAYFVLGGMSERKEDDWRHIHAWGSWSSCTTEDGQVASTKLCGSCKKLQLLRM